MIFRTRSILVEFVITADAFLFIFEIDFRASGDLDCLLLTAQLKRRDFPITSPIKYRRPGGRDLPPQPPYPLAPQAPVPFPPNPPAEDTRLPGFKAPPPNTPDIPTRLTPQIF